MDEQITDAETRTIDRLARIEVKLDNMRDERAALHGRLDRQATRLDRLERFMWLAVGLAGAAAIPNVAEVIAGMH